MQLGMIGLGRMGANMVRRLMKNGHTCVVYDRSAEAVKQLVTEGAVGASSLDEFVAKLTPPRAAWLMVPSTAAAGTISHAARGGVSFATNSSSDDAPTAPSVTSCFTASALRSYTTHVCPFFIRRRTMFAPIRPSPIIPSCMTAPYQGACFPEGAFFHGPREQQAKGYAPRDGSREGPQEGPEILVALCRRQRKEVPAEALRPRGHRGLRVGGEARRPRSSRNGRRDAREAAGHSLRAGPMGPAPHLPGNGRGRERRSDQARHVRRQPAGLPGGFVQGALRRRARPRLPLAQQQAASRKGPDRHL